MLCPDTKINKTVSTNYGTTEVGKIFFFFNSSENISKNLRWHCPDVVVDPCSNFQEEIKSVVNTVPTQTQR